MTSMATHREKRFTSEKALALYPVQSTVFPLRFCALFSGLVPMHMLHSRPATGTSNRRSVIHDILGDPLMSDFWQFPPLRTFTMAQKSMETSRPGHSTTGSTKIVHVLSFQLPRAHGSSKWILHGWPRGPRLRDPNWCSLHNRR